MAHRITGAPCSSGVCFFPHLAVRLRADADPAAATPHVHALLLSGAGIELSSPSWMGAKPRDSRPDVEAFFAGCAIRASIRVPQCGCSYERADHERIRVAAQALFGAREVLDVRYAWVWTGARGPEPAAPTDWPVDGELDDGERERLLRFARPAHFDYATLRPLAGIARGPS